MRYARTLQLPDFAHFQLVDLRAEMKKLETFDTMQVVKREADNQRLKKYLEECKNGFFPTVQPTPAHGMTENIVIIQLKFV